MGVKWGVCRGLGPVHATAACGTGLILAAAMAWPLLVGTPLGSALDPLFSLLCHRIPQRCLFIAGEPMPFCARCLGMWIGQFVASAGALLGADRWRPWRLKWGAGLAAIGLASWLLGRCEVTPDWPYERLVAGIIGGVGLYILITRPLLLLIRRSCARRR